MLAGLSLTEPIEQHLDGLTCGLDAAWRQMEARREEAGSAAKVEIVVPPGRLAGPLPGMHDPSGPGRLRFAFVAAMAETERENIRESTLEELDTAARKGQARRPPARHHRRHAPHCDPPPHRWRGLPRPREGVPVNSILHGGCAPQAR